MKFQNATVYGSKDILKLQILFESLLVTIKPGKSITNVGVSPKECFEHIMVVPRKLNEASEQIQY